jgi:arylsulfatase A-like enzyme/Flp pilus assembly protein TadD
VSGWRYARASAPVNGPIILVSIDALRADRLSAYGSPRGRTPAIDAVAADGVVFERAYAHVPQTLPSHASLLTGRLPFETGVRDSVGLPLTTSERLVQEMLSARGFATAGIVSSFLLRKETGIGRGFALFDADLPAAESGHALARRGLDSEGIAEHWLNTIGTTRAFLFLHFAEPHEPRHIESDGADRQPVESTSYDAAVAAADEAINRLVRYLKAHQLYDQSTIILTADHGEGLGDHGEDGHGLLVYEEALHVPLIIKPPAGIGAGRRVRTLVQQIDVVPTILDLAKAPVPDNLRGRSLTPLFEDNARFEDRIVYSESLFGYTHFGWAPLTSVTDGRYRFITGASAELYDLQADPEERQNVAGTHPEIVETLTRALSAFGSTTSTRPPETVSAADRERFEEMGYVGIVADEGPAGAAAPDNAVEIVEQYRRASRLLGTRQWAAALEAFQHLTILEPSSPDAWTQLAAAAYRTERHEAAARAYRKVIELTPLRAEGYLGTAAALLKLRRFEEAREIAQRIVDAGIGGMPARAAAHQLLARVALGRRNPDAARLAAAEAEIAAPEIPVVAYVNGRIAFEQRRYAEALDQFEQALSTIARHPQPPLADLQLYAAESLLRTHRRSQAELLFRDQLKDTPFSPRALAGLASIYTATGRAEEAASLAQH